MARYSGAGVVLDAQVNAGGVDERASVVARLYAT